MKKLQLFALLLSFAAFTLSSCGSDTAELTINWDGDKGGTLEIFNGSNKDMVLFIGQQPTSSNIMGGVRAGETVNFDLSFISDFSVGGYTIIRGISRKEYNANGLDLSKSKIEYQAMATYGAGKRYRMIIDLKYTGDYGFMVTNVGRVGMELRKDSPQGEKVAYLPALQVKQIIYTQTQTGITLFPVYVFYDKRSGEISTLNATSMYESQLAAPRALGDPSGVQQLTFPKTDTWEQIVNNLKSPVAYVTVRNNAGQACYFGGEETDMLSQEGYDVIISSERLTFEIKSTDEGQEVQLYAKFYSGMIKVPVLTEAGVTPVVRNGYDYTITIRGSGQNASDYSATIAEVKKRDLSDQLESI